MSRMLHAAQLQRGMCAVEVLHDSFAFFASVLKQDAQTRECNVMTP